MIVLLIEIWIVSMELFFKETFNNSIIFNFFFILFLVDILLNFSTGVYIKGNLVLNFQQICKIYLKSGFTFDSLTLLGFYFSRFEKLKYLSIIFLLRFNSFINLWRNFRENFQYNTKISEIFSLIKIFFMILFFSHFCAGIMNIIAYYLIEHGNSTNTWLHSKNLENSSWDIRYLNAFYFSIVTQVTVGYGDISPQHPIEKFFSMFNIIIIISIIFIFNLIYFIKFLIVVY